MKKEFIETWIKMELLRNRQIDKEKIKSMINSAEINARVAGQIKINEETATLIFREIYESIRQLGDIKWWLLGYEPSNHEISLEILKEFDIKEKIKLNSLYRFKKIRHDANYRGIIVLSAQAEEIIEFWNKCCLDIISILNKKLQ